MFNLLLRFYDPQRGRITIAIGDEPARDIRDLPLETLRSLIGYVQQDIFLFAGDIAPGQIEERAALVEAVLERRGEQAAAIASELTTTMPSPR